LWCFETPGRERERERERVTIIMREREGVDCRSDKVMMDKYYHY
jgi:hypothetical protein